MGLRFLPLTRHLIIVAVFGSFLVATTLIVYGGFAALQLMWRTVAAGRITTAGAKALVLGSIELVDLFLLGTGEIRHLEPRVQLLRK